MNLGSIISSIMGGGGSEKNASYGASGDMAKAWFNAAQSGALADGSATMADLGRSWMESSAPSKAPVPQEKKTEGGLSQSTMDLLGIPAGAVAPQPAPQQAAPAPAPANTPVAMVAPSAFNGFNYTAPSGSKPKNYVPANLSFVAPGPSLLAALGVRQQQGPAFVYTPPSGTKSKNYVPANMTVNAPQAAGPQTMAQIMDLMRAGQISPFGTRTA